MIRFIISILEMKKPPTFMIFTVLLSLQLISAAGICRERSIPEAARSLQAVEKSNSLQVRKGTPFKIAIFADLHFGEDPWTDWAPRQDVNSLKVMSTVLDAETPGFVVYLGDVITANNIAIHNASLYWDKAISPARDRNIPWATLFGNHDDAKFEWPSAWFSSSGVPPTRCPGTTSECPSRGTTRVELVQEEIKASVKGLSRTMMGPNQLLPSVSNYVLPLKSSDPSKPAVALLYFLDSGGGSYPGVISNAQVEWFKTTSNTLNPNLRIPELIFWHIPSKAYEKVAPPSTDDSISKPCVGSITFDEKVATQDAENGMMAVLENRSAVKAVFVGHNHGLDWCCPGEKNLWLCFARHTGYGGYGIWDRGSRIVEITETPLGIKSWIRMEDGFVHSEVNLSRA